MISRILAVSITILASADAPAGELVGFRYYSPGVLLGVGESGVTDRKVHLPDLTFPVEFDVTKHIVILNSQMYNPGGACHWGTCKYDDGKEGDRCAQSNYDYPWRDTFCEKAGRTYATAGCPDNRGHQGLDIRMPSVLKGSKGKQCKSGSWYAVAAADAQIAAVTGAVVRLVDSNGRAYIYRHLDPKSLTHLHDMSSVKRGERIGVISGYNNPGTALYTPPHLHLEIVRPTERSAFVPSYSSMIVAYRKQIGIPIQLDAGGNLPSDEARELR
ncbi:hypothetical protein [Bradyrhizobium sp.]|uniref:hypothetical protein n=1 Tax=Bradyrhizobium sp. TaxID=376 RepID=UPI00403764ED